jgi:hypothetical protein
VLLVIDDDEYRSKVEEAKAALAASQAAPQTTSREKNQEAKIQNAEAMVKPRRRRRSASRERHCPRSRRLSDSNRAQRQEALLASKVTTRQQLESAAANAEHPLTPGQQSGRPKPGAGRAGEQPGAGRGREAELTAPDSRDAVYRRTLKQKGGNRRGRNQSATLVSPRPPTARSASVMFRKGSWSRRAWRRSIWSGATCISWPTTWRRN